MVFWKCIYSLRVSNPTDNKKKQSKNSSRGKSFNIINSKFLFSFHLILVFRWCLSNQQTRTQNVYFCCCVFPPLCPKICATWISETLPSPKKKKRSCLSYRLFLSIAKTQTRARKPQQQIQIFSILFVCSLGELVKSFSFRVRKRVRERDWVKYRLDLLKSLLNLHRKHFSRTQKCGKFT
jgi:hypothetical protein